MPNSLSPHRSDETYDSVRAKRSLLNVARRTKGLSRRSLFVVGIGAAAAALGGAAYQANVTEERLTTDPDGAHFVYRDGVITRVN